MQAMEEIFPSQRNLIVQTQLADDGFVQVSVIDSGKGIAPELMVRLFEPFYTTKPQGLGVGLNLSRSIVTSHGGRMLASANPTGGMRFTFALPAQSPLAHPAEKS
jgi:two-component system sensor kinase FixL